VELILMFGTVSGVYRITALQLPDNRRKFR
jgi:hypothetical protein